MAWRCGYRERLRNHRAADSLVDSCTGEGGDEDLDTDATNAMGRSVAQALQDDQEEDLELARDLQAVGFDEPKDCCGILTRFGHASLARYSCAMRFTVHKSISRLAHRRDAWCPDLLVDLRTGAAAPTSTGAWASSSRASFRGSSAAGSASCGASVGSGIGFVAALRRAQTERRHRGRPCARSSAASSRRS